MQRTRACRGTSALQSLSPGESLWLAGFLSGRGTLGLAGRRYRRVVVSVTGNDRDLVAHVGLLMGVAPKRRRIRGSTLWQARVTGIRATAVLRAVQPFLASPKSSQARELLAACDDASTSCR